MTDLLVLFFTGSAPNWFVALLVAAIAIQFRRQWEMEQWLRLHQRSISNMDAWADVTDERLDRVDWVRGPRAANDSRRPWRRTG